MRSKRSLRLVFNEMILRRTLSFRELFLYSP